MKEIVTRLHENRQIQLAKEILENAGYKVEEAKDSFYVGWAKTTVDELAAHLKEHPALGIEEREDGYYISSGSEDTYARKIEPAMIDRLKKDPRFKDKFLR